MDSDSEIEYSSEILKKNSTCHQCTACGKNISSRRNLVRHLRTIHCIEPKVKRPQLKCSFNEDCTFLCATTELLREHLQKAHDFQVQEIVLNFRSQADFEKWKQKEEENSNARYVQYTGLKYRGTKKIYYLRCHRSGVIRCGKDVHLRKRSKPSKGYTQCGLTCPSSIKISETKCGNIQVNYYPVHLGHSLDDECVKYIKLSPKEKEEIVGKLVQGEPVKKIVSDARKIKGSKLSRINLLCKRDVYNLKKKVNYIEKECDHDGKIIDDWVKHINSQEPTNNPIAFYSPIDETKDYTLVLIHPLQKIVYSLSFDESIIFVKTKRGKPNIDFNLIAVSVICENGDAYPIAFCITHKTEYLSFYTFFKIIYQHFGLIKAQIFVSDNVTQYYLAWKNVMGECENKLICTFEIELYWEQKLNEFGCPVNKQKAASSQLKALLHQPYKDTFESDLLKVLKSWEEDEDMKLFSNFFHKYYVKKRFEWATCYRIHSSRKETINNYLEPINTILDSIYEESYNDLKNSINLLFTFVRDVCLLKLLKWDKDVILEKEQESLRNHEMGVKIKDVKGCEPKWVVRDGDVDYVVRKIDSGCDKKCGVFCESCEICTHNYSCVCIDYVTGFNVCRHLHAVAMASGDIKVEHSQDILESLKKSVISETKSFIYQLEITNLSEEYYNKVLSVISTLKEDIVKKTSSSNELKDLR